VDEGLRISYPADRSEVQSNQARIVGLVKDASIQTVTCRVQGGMVLGTPVIPIVHGAFTVPIRLQKRVNEISTQGYLSRGLAPEKGGDNPRAIEKLEELQDTQKDMPEIHYHLGRLYEKEGGPEQALRDYKKALGPFFQVE
jgi:tetratricopeptide (TPR) repeat protein